MLGSEDAAGSALAAAARLGPYFAWSPRVDEAGWRPMSELLDPGVVAGRVATGQRVLMGMSGLGPDAIGERVVASTIFLGLASRLVSPLLAAAALTGSLPLAEPARLRWRAVESGPLPLSYGRLDAVEATPAALGRVAIGGLVAPLLTVFERRFVLSPQVLWGNVASALGGAAAMIADAAPTPGPEAGAAAPTPAEAEAAASPAVAGAAAAARPAAERSAALVTALLDQPPLKGMATLHRPEPGRARWVLQRHNCCLYYRIPGGGTCGDCVLTFAGRRRR